LRNLKLTVRPKTLGAFIGASVTLRRGTGLDVIYVVKDEKGDLVADSHSIMARWRKYFSQLLNVNGVKEVGQAEIHTAEPLAPEPSASEFELAIDKLKSHKSPGIDQIVAELIKAGGRTIFLEIYKLITSIWKKEKLPEECKKSIRVPIHKKRDKTDCNNYRGISLLPTTYKTFFPTINVASDATRRLLIIYSAFAKYLRKNGNTTKKFVSSLRTSRKLMIQLGGRSYIRFSSSLVSLGNL